MSQIPKKPKGKPIPLATSGANGGKSMVGSAFEQVFNQQKARKSLMIRTIRLPRAMSAITLANIAGG